MSDNPEQLSFPGLDLEASTAGRPITATERAAMQTLGALRDRGLLTPDHALHVQLVLDLARAVGLGVVSGRASAVAMAAKQLQEAMGMLPGLDVAGAGDIPAGGTDWQAFREAVEAEGAA